MNLFKILILSFVLSANVASAQLLGGMLCGLGMFCPPTSPPETTMTDIKVIKDSPIGSLIPEYFGGEECMTFHNTMDHFFKMEVGKSLDWSTSGWGVGLGAKLVVLKLGVAPDDRHACFQYKSELRVYKETKLIAKEDYTGAACTSDLLDQKNTLNLFVETDSRLIKWIK